MKLTLKLVQVIFRHGHRTPSQEEILIFKITDPSIYETQGLGQLTDKGKEQTYNLGRLLKREYNEFLNNIEPSDVYGYSSISERTKMSLKLVLSGLFSSPDSNKWDPKMNLDHIDINNATDPCDALMTSHECINFRKIYEEEISKLDDYKKQFSKFDDLADYLTKFTDLPIKSNVLYYCAWSTYIIGIHKNMNLQIPDWCTEDIQKSLYDLMALGYFSMSLTPKLKQFTGGPLVKQMLENIRLNNNGSSNKKLYLYSGHDTTIASFITVQNLKSFRIPPFGCALISEKYNDEHGQEFIRMRSWDGSSEDFTVVQIDDSEEYCPMEKYLNIVKDAIPTDKDLHHLVSEGSANKYL